MQNVVLALLLALPVASALLATPGITASRAEKVAFHLSEATKLEKERGPAADAVGKCGALKAFPNSKPKDYKDQRKTKYDKDLKKEVPVLYAAGDKVAFECAKGYTTTGAKDGEKGFDVECSENGYYKPSAVCVKVMACGELPKIEHAVSTGDVKDNKVKFQCEEGYSLDGEKVIAGGFGKNKFFEIECIDFTAQYSNFEGACKPYSFVPTGEVVRIYNQVFQTLFEVSCKGTIKKQFAQGGDLSKMDAACGRFEGSAGACSGLVSKIKADFEKQQKARKDHEKDSKKEWYDEDKDKPGINAEATEFCTKLWKLVELPSL